MTGESALELYDAQGQVLLSVLRLHGAENTDFRVDLREGRFWWQSAEGVPLVQARTQVICSYALSNQSVMMAWANSSLPSNAGIPEVVSMEASYEGQTESNAWALAAQAALEAGAHFLYRAPNPQMWIFLALWDVRTAGDDAATAPRPPRRHVLWVLDQLGSMEQGEHRAVLMRNYGASLSQSATEMHHGQPWGDLVASIGARLIALATADEEEIRTVFGQLKAEAESGLKAS